MDIKQGKESIDARGNRVQSREINVKSVEDLQRLMGRR